jgi:O-antigen/teichoic acid export membrane protein
MRLPFALTRPRLRQLWYAPLLALAMGLMLVRLLVMARLLDVAAFASYSAALLVSSSLCMLACLGLQSILQRDLPVMIARGRERPSAVLLAQCVLVAVACAAVGIAAAMGGVHLAGLPPALLALGMLHGLSQQLFLIATVESRSRGEPLRFARQNLDRSLVVLAAGAASAGATGSASSALLAEALLSLALALGLLRPQLRIKAIRAGGTLRLALRRLPRARWRSAAALLAVASIGFVLINIDRWIAAETLPAHRFAQYAFAWMVLMVAQSSQVVINASLFPLLARHFAGAGCRSAFRICAQASLLLLLAAGLTALPVWALLDYAISRWFAPYSDARAVLPALLFVAALRVSDFWSSFMVIIGHEDRLLALQLVCAAASGLAWWWLLKPATAAGDLLSIALLAVLLSASSYLAAAWASWLAARESPA